MSIEPILGDCHLVDLAAHLGGTLDWLIIGAMTGIAKKDLWLDEEGRVETPKRYPDLTPLPLGRGKWTLQPKIEWVEEIIRVCDKAGIPVFIKNNLKPVMRNSAWRIRQEVPDGQ